MKNIELNTTASLPIIGLGTWRSKPGEVYQAIRWALKIGYTHFDCADIYNNQAEIGQAFHDAFNEDNLKREDLFITSKLWNDAHEPQYVRPTLDQTLKDLQIDYLDLWLMHWPVAQKHGTTEPQSEQDMVSLTDLPLELTWAEMEKCLTDGKVKAIGVSNFGQKNLQTIIDKGQISPAVNQIECHPYLQQNELIDFCRKNMIAVTAYSPLGSGTESSTPELLNDPVIKQISERLNISPAQTVLAWNINRGLCVIPKSVHEKHLQENIAAVNINLDEADMKQIASLDRNKRYINGSSFAFGDYTTETIFA